MTTQTLDAFAPRLPLAAFLAGAQALLRGARLDACECGDRLWLYGVPDGHPAMLRKGGWLVWPHDALSGHGASPRVPLGSADRNRSSLRPRDGRPLAQIDLEGGCSCLPF